MQHNVLGDQIEARAVAFDRKVIRKRGVGSLRRRVKGVRKVAAFEKAAVAARSVDARRATCVKTNTGRQRQRPWTMMRCVGLLPAREASGVKVPKSRGNHYKSKAVIKEGKAKDREKQKEMTQGKKQQSRKRPMNSRERRLAQSLPAGVVPGQRVPQKRKRTGGKAPAAQKPCMAQTAQKPQSRPARAAAAKALAQIELDESADESAEESREESAGESGEESGDEEMDFNDSEADDEMSEVEHDESDSDKA